MVAKIGLRMIGAEFDVAVAGKPQKRHAEQNQRHGQNIKPAGVGEDLLLQKFEVLVSDVGEKGGERDQKKNEDCRGEEYRFVDMALRIF